MPTYIVYAGPPLAHELYADWSSSPDGLVEISDYEHVQSAASPDLPKATSSENQTTVLTDSYIDASVSAGLTLPTYHFDVHKLTPLTSISSLLKTASTASVLGLITSLPTLQDIKLKTRPGHTTKLLKFDLHDESSKKGEIGKLSITAWGDEAVELARELRLYDIVNLHNLQIYLDSYSKQVIGKASSASTFQVCWRTVITSPDDDSFQPKDLVACARFGHPQSMRVNDLVKFAQAWRALGAP